MVDAITKHQETKAKSIKIQSNKTLNDNTTTHANLTPKLSNSGVSKPKKAPSRSEDIDSDSFLDSDSELCCVCNLFTPREIRNSSSLIIVKWVECSNCGHWVDLGYCTKVRVVRGDDNFLCHHYDKTDSN